MIRSAINSALSDNFSMIFIFTVVVVTIRLVYLNVHREKFIFYKELFMFAFLVYALLLFYVVSFQDVNYGTDNFTPFKEILRYEVGSKIWIKNIVGNIILFVPYGVFVSFLLRTRKFQPILIISSITSLVIEYTQLKIGRTFDIDDIILNITGGFIGFLIYIILDTLDNHLPQFARTTGFKNLCAVLIALAFIFIYTNFSLWGILKWRI